MNDDLELEQWQSLWQADPLVPPDLRRLAKKQVKHKQVMLYADIAVTVVIGGGMIVWFLVNRQPSVGLLTTFVWAILLAAWIFRWFNRDNWTGAAPNTELFLERLRDSYQASLRNLKFGWLIGVIQLVFISIWAFRRVNESGPLSVWQFMTLDMSVAVWTCVVCLFGWTIWLFVTLRRKLASVSELQLNWDNSEPGSDEVVNPGSTADVLSSPLERLVRELRRRKKKFERL